MKTYRSLFLLLIFVLLLFVKGSAKAPFKLIGENSEVVTVRCSQIIRNNSIFKNSIIKKNYIRTSIKWES